MTETTKVFQYRILEERPLDHLTEFKHHPRLTVFYHKGTTCVQCSKTGTRLIKGEGRSGHHWDIYTDDLYPITVDHIIPKSLGGGEELENKQPMCAGCNFNKGNGVVRPRKTRKTELPPNMVSVLDLENPEKEVVGKTLWRRSGKSRTMKPVGEASSVAPNPHTGETSAKLVGNDRTFLHLSSLYLCVTA
jgi:hypothetical protein